MVDASPEAPLARTPENYRELQAMIHYADPLFIGRNGAWIGSQAVLLAIAVAQFDPSRRAPASPGSTTKSASTRDHQSGPVTWSAKRCGAVPSQQPSPKMKPSGHPS